MTHFEEMGGQTASDLPVELLLTVDWTAQAEGCALMYQQTGDTDYELMRIQAEANELARCRILRLIYEY